MTRDDAERVAEAVCEAAGLSWRTLPHLLRADATQAALEALEEAQAADARREADR